MQEDCAFDAFDAETRSRGVFAEKTERSQFLGSGFHSSGYGGEKTDYGEGVLTKR
jgi:hypothetical protein